jgi:hypothetical protein
MMHGFSSISFYYLFLDMVLTYDDAQRPNSHKEKLFSPLVFFLAIYKVGVTCSWAVRRAEGSLAGLK